MFEFKQSDIGAIEFPISVTTGPFTAISRTVYITDGFIPDSIRSDIGYMCYSDMFKSYNGSIPSICGTFVELFPLLDSHAELNKILDKFTIKFTEEERVIIFLKCLSFYFCAIKTREVSNCFDASAVHRTVMETCPDMTKIDKSAMRGILRYYLKWRFGILRSIFTLDSLLLLYGTGKGKIPSTFRDSIQVYKKKEFISYVIKTVKSVDAMAQFPLFVLLMRARFDTRQSVFVDEMQTYCYSLESFISHTDDQNSKIVWGSFDVVNSLWQSAHHYVEYIRDKYHVLFSLKRSRKRKSEGFLNLTTVNELWLHFVETNNVASFDATALRARYPIQCKGVWVDIITQLLYRADNPDGIRCVLEGVLLHEKALMPTCEERESKELAKRQREKTRRKEYRLKKKKKKKRKLGEGNIVQ